MADAQHTSSVSPEEARAAVAANPLWYHTIEVAPGVVTPGNFDLRPVMAAFPWPDVRGKRCLDIGTYDGALAFELEKRGASEVVATDIPDHHRWDHLPRERGRAIELLETIAGEKGRGFEIVRDLLGSKVERRFLSIYELSPETVGRFDVVVCGSLLLHLRDPFAALAAARSVCDGYFLSIEQVDTLTSRLLPRRSVLRLHGQLGQWAVPNEAGHSRMIEMAGFDIVQAKRSRPEPFGPAHPEPPRSWRRTVRRVVERGSGVPTHSVLARPAPLG